MLNSSCSEDGPVLVECASNAMSILKSKAAETAFSFLHYLDDEASSANNAVTTRSTSSASSNSHDLTDRYARVVASNLDSISRYPHIDVIENNAKRAYAYVGETGYDGHDDHSMLSIRLNHSIFANNNMSSSSSTSSSSAIRYIE